MKGLTRVPGSLGEAVHKRYTDLILDECQRCGIEA